MLLSVCFPTNSNKRFCFLLSHFVMILDRHYDSRPTPVQPVSVQNHSVGVMFLHLVESTKQYKSNACRNIKYSDHTVYSADCKQLKLVVTS